MTETVSCSQVVQLSSGLQLTTSTLISVEAYDVVEVPIPDAAVDKELQVQPGGTGEVKFMIITSNPYSDQLTYKVNSASATESFALDSPQVFLGSGAFAMLGGAPPTSLFFTSSVGKSATVTVLVGRKALV